MTNTAGPPTNPSPGPPTAVIDVAREVATVVNDASPEERAAHTIAAAAWRHQLNRHALAALIDQHLATPTQDPATNHGAPNK